MNSEFTFTDSDFAKVRSLIHGKAGISLGEQKAQMVYSRLSRRLRELQMTDFASYLRSLEADPNSAEWQSFINSLTTNLTSFFREAHHFPVLADHVKKCTEPVTVWCAAASTGEEPYSLAITLTEALGAKAASARVISTDIDTAVLAKAATATFTTEQVKGMSPERLRKFFHKGTGANEGKVRVRAEVAGLVKFSRLNLLDPSWSVKEPVDAIFCRNVMIYFDKPTQRKILERFETLLKPGGLLFAGHSENASLVDPNFKSVGPTVYQLPRKAGVR
ncbi:CheR family methyltransferase [Variovorax ginsengisoli]|uniref:Chemotaxis protein methyltransferase n=1 Tax=Variovorax ginsengisoli TaxID=363844 RepID=A0ABT9SEK0_9BURK|nr:CheR family methyltransferase [Variovorax ginsengisoli]MDP9902314.1 chemotaxis protein methyltransferase CheR [Variovorax ginsengisoli]